MRLRNISPLPNIYDSMEQLIALELDGWEHKYVTPIPPGLNLHRISKLATATIDYLNDDEPIISLVANVRGKGDLLFAGINDDQERTTLMENVIDQIVCSQMFEFIVEPMAETDYIHFDWYPGAMFMPSYFHDEMLIGVQDRISDFFKMKFDLVVDVNFCTSPNHQELDAFYNEIYRVVQMQIMLGIFEGLKLENTISDLL